MTISRYNKLMLVVMLGKKIKINLLVGAVQVLQIKWVKLLSLASRSLLALASGEDAY